MFSCCPPPPLAKIEITGKANWARVGVFPVGLGEDGRLLELLQQADYEGIVLAAMGGGHVPQTMAPLLGKAAKTLPIVLCTRAPEGPTLKNTYSYAGSEMDLLRRGLLYGGRLTPYKARILLMLLLTAYGRDAAREFVNRAALV